MKQRIDPEQLNELTKEQKEKLWEWWFPQLGDSYIFKYEGEYWPEPELIDGRDVYNKYMNEDGEDPIPLLSIGQMIEFLNEHFVKITINDCNIYWRVADDKPNGHAISRDELCDALWEAVKKGLIGIGTTEDAQETK